MMKTKMEEWTLLDKRANYILQKTIRLQMEAWTLLYIVEDNKNGDGSSQTKGVDYIHSYMKQRLVGR
jgi:hypothetical protein